MSLQLIRDRAQGWIAWTIVALIIVVFAIWGINSYFAPDPNVPVAQVGDDEITLPEFRRAYENERQRLRAQLGNNFDPQLLEAMGMKQQVLDRLVEERLQIQTAVEQGYRIGDRHLAAHIAQLEPFQEDGKFSRARYEQVLSNNLISPAEFEQERRRLLLLRQPVRGVADTAIVTDQELESIVRLRDQKRDIGYAIVPVERFKDQVEVTDEEIAAYYEDNKIRFQNPETVKLAYLELSQSALAQDMPVDEESVKQRYESQKEMYGTPERRKASHILIEAPAGADAETEQQARAEAESVLVKLREGADFAELAKQHSDDPGSAQSGGDLGFFGRGAMVPEFEEAVYNLKVGEISEPIKTQYGFHIIRLDQVEPGSVKPLAEVRDEIERDLRLEQAEDQFYDLAERLDTLTFENPETLTVAAEELGLEVKTVDAATRNTGEGIGAFPQVREAAFDPDVLEERNNSRVLEVEPNRVVVVRVEQHQPAATKSLETVKEQVVEALRNDKARELARDQAEQILQAVRGGESAEVVAQNNQLEWKRPGLVGRQEPAVDGAVLEAAFAAPQPQADAPVANSTTLPSGDLALFAVYEVQSGDPKALDDGARQALRDQLARQHGANLYGDMLELWKREAKVVTFPEKI